MICPENLPSTDDWIGKFYVNQQSTSPHPIRRHGCRFLPESIAWDLTRVHCLAFNRVHCLQCSRASGGLQIDVTSAICSTRDGVHSRLALIAIVRCVRKLIPAFHANESGESLLRLTVVAAIIRSETRGNTAPRSVGSARK